MIKKISISIDKFIQNSLSVKVLKVFNNFFSHLPHLPLVVSKFLLFLAPWLALISAILGLIAGPIASLLGLLSLITLQPLIILEYVVTALVMIVNTIIMFKAFKPLKQKQIRGWIYLFWSDILWFFSGLLDVFLGEENLLVLIISTILGLYLLFEMKQVVVSEEANQVTPSSQANI